MAERIPLFGEHLDVGEMFLRDIHDRGFFGKREHRKENFSLRREKLPRLRQNAHDPARSVFPGVAVDVRRVPLRVSCNRFGHARHVVHDQIEFHSRPRLKKAAAAAIDGELKIFRIALGQFHGLGADVRRMNFGVRENQFRQNRRDDAAAAADIQRRRYGLVGEFSYAGQEQIRRARGIKNLGARADHDTLRVAEAFVFVLESFG